MSLVDALPPSGWFFIHRKMDSASRSSGYRDRVISVRNRARAWDGMVVVLVVCVLGEVVATNQDVPLALSVPVALVMTVSLLWGQRRPRLVAGLVLGAWLVQGFAGSWQLEPQFELLPVCLVFWCLGAYTADPAARWAFGAAIVAMIAHEPSDAMVLGPLVAGVFAAGRLMRSREQLAAALRKERAQVERYAAAEERARISRDLHDIVGHSIALMTVQAGAERVAIGDSRPQTSQVLQQIETNGRQTMQEMRRLLGILRGPEEHGEFNPQPGLAQLEALAEQVKRAGVDVAVLVEGEPDGLLPGLDVAAYRIVQEALTNVLRHAEASRATVFIEYGQASLGIEVTDDGVNRPSTTDGHGHGTAGMRERAALYGGRVESGPAPGGGWRVFADLPKESNP